MALLPIWSDRWQTPQPPRFLFLDLNQHCNLKCKHCMYWLRDDADVPGLLTVDQRAAIISEFAELNPDGSVVICGGESMLNPERFFPVTIQCREVGLKGMAVVNGTKIVNDKDATRMVLEGPIETTVSLNSHRPEVHDRTRGMIGAFDSATGAIRRLLAARERHAPTTAVFAMAVMCEQNYRDLDAFYDFVLNDLKTDKLKLNFLQPTFGPVESMDEDKFFRENIIRDVKALEEVLLHCDKKYGLNLQPEWIDVVTMYHRNVLESGDIERGWAGKGTERPICNSYERNIMINMTGEAKLCFSDAFPGTQINRPGDLKKFWYGNHRLRNRMATCTQYCGISHSVRRVSATKQLVPLEAATEKVA